ncbi:hypothetical protein [Spirosoma pomorum]
MKKPRLTSSQLIILILLGVLFGFESLYMFSTLSTWWQLLQRAIHRLDHAYLASAF